MSLMSKLRKKSFTWLLVAFGGLTNSIQAFCFDNNDLSTQIPMSGMSESKFIPEGWKVLDRATGDLNGDGLQDLALILARKDEQLQNSSAPSRQLSKRCLIILFKDRSGQYRRSALDWNIILPAGAGGETNAEATRHMKTTQGSLWIEQQGGNDAKWGQVHKLKWIDGDWKVCGEIDQNYKPSEAHGFVQDQNFLTGLAEYRYWDGLDENNNFSQSFYWLRLPAAGAKKTGRATNKTNDKSISKVQPVPKSGVLKLSSVANILVGKNDWHGPSDLSAEVFGFHSGRQFTLIAEVVDDVVTKRDRLVLLDSNGQPVKPISSLRSVRTNGYRDTLQFSMDELQLPKNFKEKGYVFGTIEVHDYDSPNTLHCSMTTSCGGRRYPSELEFADQPGLPRLSTWSNTNPLDALAGTRVPAAQTQQSETSMRNIIEKE